MMRGEGRGPRCFIKREIDVEAGSFLLPLAQAVRTLLLRTVRRSKWSSRYAAACDGPFRRPSAYRPSLIPSALSITIASTSGSRAPETAILLPKIMDGTPVTPISRAN
jgi:hypothetical protein